MQRVAKRGSLQLTLNLIIFFFPLPLWVPYFYFSPYMINAIAGTMVNFSQLNAFFPPQSEMHTGSWHFLVLAVL